MWPWHKKTETETWICDVHLLSGADDRRIRWKEITHFSKFEHAAAYAEMLLGIHPRHSWMTITRRRL